MPRARNQNFEPEQAPDIATEAENTATFAESEFASEHAATDTPAPYAQSQEEHAAPSDAAQNAPVEPSVPPTKIDVRITSTRNNYGDPTRAVATVVLNDSIAIKGVRVVKGENGLFCSLPARRLANGSYSEVVNPITKDFALQMNSSVLSAYQMHLEQQIEESTHTPHVYEPEPSEHEEPLLEPEM